MQKSKFLSPLFLSLFATSALATEVPCDYVTKDKVVYEGQIESVKSVKKDVFVNPNIKDIRKCVVSKEACSHAENRAKTKVMNKVIPETLKSEKNLKCALTNIRKSCKVVYMNTSIGKVKFMESCEK